MTTSPQINNCPIPASVDFKVELNFLVALLKPEPKSYSKYDRPEDCYVRPQGEVIPPPPQGYRYTPPKPLEPITDPSSSWRSSALARFPNGGFDDQTLLSHLERMGVNTTGFQEVDGWRSVAETLLQVNNPQIADEKLKGYYHGWALYIIAKEFGEAGLQTNWPSSDAPASIDIQGPRDPDTFDSETVWTVAMGSDSLLELQETEYDWMPVRITSPVYSKQVDRTLFVSQLDTALSILNTEFITFAPSSSRLKVLVRPAEAGFFRRPYITSTMAEVVSALDPMLAEIHAPHCGPGSLQSLGLQFTRAADMYENIDMNIEFPRADFVQDPWSDRVSPNRQPLPSLAPQEHYWRRLPLAITATQSDDIARMLDLVPYIPGTTKTFNTNSYFKAIKAVSPAYDFSAIKTCSPPAMIAFNQHYGTLDLEAIVHWTAVCGHLTAFAVERPDQEAKHQLRLEHHEIRAKELDIVTYLKRYGLDAAATYYEKQMRDFEIPDLKMWPRLRLAVPYDRSELQIGNSLGAMNRGNKPNLDDKVVSSMQFREQLFISRAVVDDWYRNPSPRNPDSRYTFGIEVEALYATLANPRPGFPFQDPSPQDQRRFLTGYSQEKHAEQLAAVINGLGAPSMSELSDSDHSSHSAAGVKQYLAEMGLRFDRETKAQYQYWSVVNDASLSTLNSWKGYDQVIGLEIASPVFRDCPESWESILNVIIGLTRKLRVVTDQSCSIHVNVGSGNILRPLHFYRKMACAALLADRVLASFCKVERKEFNCYSTSFREESNLAKGYKENGKIWRALSVPDDFFEHFPRDELPREELGMLKRLWSITKLLQLIDICTNVGAGRSSVSLNGVSPPGANHLDTSAQFFGGRVEFRHMENEMDAEQILHFTQVVLALYKFVDTAPPSAWKSYTRNLVRCKDTWDYDLDILKTFLSHVGMEHDYGYWEGRVKQRRAEAPVWREKIRRMNYGNCYEAHDWLNDQIGGVEVIPALEPSKVQYLREKICRRQKFVDYANEKLADVCPKITTIDPLTDLEARLSAVLNNSSIIQTPPEQLIQEIFKADRITQTFADEDLKARQEQLSQGTPPELGFKTLMDHFSDQPQILEAIKCQLDSNPDGEFPEPARIKNEELNELALGEEGKLTKRPFIFDSYSRPEGPMPDVKVSEEVKNLLCASKTTEKVFTPRLSVPDEVHRLLNDSKNSSPVSPVSKW